MTSSNFEKCLAITLKWEGGYSNNPDDPGGPTMRGVIQREYDAWRKKHGKSCRPVRQIEETELRTIYRDEYWNACGCDELAAGLDLCVFDAAVNSGPGRAKEWLRKSRDLNGSKDIDSFCDVRLEFLQHLGRLWRVFGAGWRRRVAGIRDDAHRMAGREHAPQEPDDGTLHAGMKGEAVRTLQQQLRALGYPAGAVDGVFGAQMYRAVILFQHDHELGGDTGVWLPAYNEILRTAVKHMNLLQRIFAWLFGASAAAQAFGGNSVLESIDGARLIFEPLHDVADWASGNIWLLAAVGCIGVIALIRLLRSEHVTAYQNFDYQGSPQGQTQTAKTETV